jgi:drug/metabolite transporter (DMT)-like permease
MPVHADRRALIAYILVCVVWGSTYTAIHIAVEHLPPFLMGGTRFLAASVILGAYVWWRGLPWPAGVRGFAHVAGCGVLFFLVGNGGVVWALQFVPSGVASVYVVMVGIWAAVLDALVPGGTGRITMPVSVGLAMAFIGSPLLVGATPAELVGADWRGPIALLVASFGWALGTVLMKRRPSPANPFANATVQMIGGGLAMLLAGLYFGEAGRVVVTARGVWAYTYLVLIGSLVGFGAYAYALHHMSPTALGTYAYVNPVVAVVLGRLLLAEPITRRTIIAMALMIGGAVVVQFGDRVSRLAPSGSDEPVQT